MDSFGASALILFAIILAFNQVVVKVSNGGFSPVFLVALRSVVAGFVVATWMAWRGKPFVFRGPVFWVGLLTGVIFSFEFMALYISLDLTDVSRASVIFYSMPVWLALAAHFLLPGERLSARRLFGLGLAMAGVAVALLDRKSGAANIWGDLLALTAAISWAAIALVLRTSALSCTNPETQLMWQLAVSAVLLGLISPLFGDLLRDPQPIHFA